MSRLEQQLRALERRHRPACSREHTRIEITGPNQPPSQDPGPCPSCGQQGETLQVLVAFDPHPAGSAPEGRSSGR